MRDISTGEQKQLHNKVFHSLGFLLVVHLLFNEVLCTNWLYPVEMRQAWPF
jgi:hypothetical protein